MPKKPQKALASRLNGSKRVAPSPPEDPDALDDELIVVVDELEIEFGDEDPSLEWKQLPSLSLINFRESLASSSVPSASFGSKVRGPYGGDSKRTMQRKMQTLKAAAVHTNPAGLSDWLLRPNPPGAKKSAAAVVSGREREDDDEEQEEGSSDDDADWAEEHDDVVSSIARLQSSAFLTEEQRDLLCDAEDSLRADLKKSQSQTGTPQKNLIFVLILCSLFNRCSC